jgi:hypothetical protein
MQSVAHFEKLLEKYRRLNTEIELLKQRLVCVMGTVDCEAWRHWKKEQARKNNVVYVEGFFSGEISDDPLFQRLQELELKMKNVHRDIEGEIYNFDIREISLEKMILSFPSLRKWISSLDEMSIFYEILSQEEEYDPQAYHAARFVAAIDSEGKSLERPEYSFYLDKAFAVWDEEHKHAFARWVNTPFFPKQGLSTLFLEPSYV